MFRFALRNVFRNKKRTYFTALSIFFAALVVALSEGWMRGWMDNIWKTTIHYQTGNIRITTEEFFKLERFLPVDEYIQDSDRLIEKIKDIPGVENVEERVRFGILLGNGNISEPAVGMGVNLQKSTLNIGKKITEGSLDGSGIYIGSGLAKKMCVRIGGELLLVTKTSEGGLNGIKLPVKGIFHYGINFLDKQYFFIDLASCKKLLRLHDATTEIYVFTKKREMTETVLKDIKPLLGKGILAQSYRTQLGNLYDVYRVMEGMMFFMEGFILFLASFVVVNTMMMTVFERIREIGTLKALGFTDGEVFLNFTFEGGIIGAIGGISGAAAGYMLVLISSFYGFNMGPFMDNVDMVMENVIYPSASILVLIISVLLSLIMPSLSSMFPAWRASRLTPSEALRKA